MRMEEYLEKLTDQIRCKLARDPIREELRCHMEDQRDAYMEEGMTEEEAEEAAVLDMGDPVLTGAEFDRLHRPNMPWRMIGLIVIASLIGFAMQYLVIAPNSDVVDFHKQFILLACGFGVMIAVCFADYSRIVPNAYWIFNFLYFFIVLLEKHWGVEVNGSAQWIYFGGFGIMIDQAMLTLLFVPVLAAELCSIRGQGYLPFVGVSLVGLLMPMFLVLKIPRISTAVVLFASSSFLLHLTVRKGWFKIEKIWFQAVYWGGIAAAGCWGLYKVFNEPHASTRLHRLFGLGEDSSYATETLRKMLHGARWIGEGKVQGDGILSYSDYLLAFIISKYGIAVGLAVMGIILFLLILLFRRSFSQKNESGMLIGVSCSMVFLAQVLLYLLSNLGMISAAGYCPFLTYGGSGIIVASVLLGLLLSVFRYEAVMSLYKKKSPQAYRMERKNTVSEEEKFWRQNRAEQIKIFLIVFVLFLFLIENSG